MNLTVHHFGKLTELFKDYAYIASAYLFGSCAAQKAGLLSDVDIALLLKEPYPKGRELIHEEDYLAYRISKALGANDVDLIDINNQGIVFQHTILKTGHLLYDADREFRIRVETRVISEFLDFEPTLRFMEQFQTQGIRERLMRE